MNEKSQNVGFFCSFASSHLKVSGSRDLKNLDILYICLSVTISQAQMHPIRLLMPLYEPGELKISLSFSEVGDTLNTDIELAVRSGARSLLVLSHLEHETKRRSETFWAYLLCFKYFVLKHVMYVVQKDLYMKMYVCVYNSCYMHMIYRISTLLICVS